MRWIPRAIAMVLLGMFTVSSIWWFTPVRPLDAPPDDFSWIAVRDGITGQQFVIDEPAVVRHIAGNLSQPALRRMRPCLSRPGTVFQLAFYHKSGKPIAKCAVNYYTILYQDHFLYYDQSGSLCYDTLAALELQKCGTSPL